MPCFVLIKMTDTPNQTQHAETPAPAAPQSQKPVLSHAERLAAKRADNLRQNLMRRKEQARNRQEQH
jgi:hypothetical protein